MKVKELTISHSLTINMGNYESEKIEISKTVKIEDNDDVEKVEKELLSGIRKALYKEEAKILSRKREK